FLVIRPIHSPVSEYNYKNGSGDGCVFVTDYYLEQPEIYKMGMVENDQETGEWIGRITKNGKTAYFKLDFKNGEQIGEAVSIGSIDYKMKAYDLQMADLVK
ncbi:MAG: hypothetical protein AAFU60_16805, partial [Bacteroidota bacterium]